MYLIQVSKCTSGMRLGWLIWVCIVPLMHWLTAETRVCLAVCRRPNKIFFQFWKKERSQGLYLESTMGLARRLPPQTLETYVCAGHHYAINKVHVY